MEDSEAVGEEFELKEILGRGAFSVVYRAIRKTDGEEVAIKRIQKMFASIHFYLSLLIS
jgi:serine/threonine protein kinase